MEGYRDNPLGDALTHRMFVPFRVPRGSEKRPRLLKLSTVML